MASEKHEGCKNGQVRGKPKLKNRSGEVGENLSSCVVKGKQNLAFADGENRAGTGSCLLRWVTRSLVPSMTQ